jgi:hypothetical protein
MPGKNNDGMQRSISDAAQNVICLNNFSIG